MKIQHALPRPGRARPPGTPMMRRRWVVSSLVVLAAIGIVGLTGPPSTASIPNAPAGWSRLWYDDFPGAVGTGIDKSTWQYDTGIGYPGGATNWGTGEVETMTNSTANVQQDGTGNLLITPVRDAAGNWTSGRIETLRSDFQPSATGAFRIAARIKMPDVTAVNGQGYWPAFWLLGEHFRPSNTNWPGAGEIDPMESANGADRVYGSLHCDVSPGGICNEKTGRTAVIPCPGSPCPGNWHEYMVELDRSTSPQTLRWYVDDVLYHTVTETDVGSATWQQATGHGFIVVLNVAMGGELPAVSPNAETVSGVPMTVDYVVAYTKG